jgi:hypothetical protein
MYAIIVGALLPLPFWLMQRRWPNSWAKFVSTPVVLVGVSFIPPSTGINYSSWFAVGFVFQFIIRKRNFQWWSKYNYVTGSALDCGTSCFCMKEGTRILTVPGLGDRIGTILSVLTIFYTLQLPKGGLNINWWGNTVFMNSLFFFSSLLFLTPLTHYSFPVHRC